MTKGELIKENEKLKLALTDKEEQIKQLMTGRAGTDYVIADYKYHEMNNALHESARKDGLIIDLENRLLQVNVLVVEQSKSINKLIDKL